MMAPWCKLPEKWSSPLPMKIPRSHPSSSTINTVLFLSLLISIHSLLQTVHERLECDSGATFQDVVVILAQAACQQAFTS